jgi:hypothetical protein
MNGKPIPKWAPAPKPVLPGQCQAIRDRLEGQSGPFQCELGYGHPGRHLARGWSFRRKDGDL